MAGEKIDTHHRTVGEVGDLFQSGNPGSHGTAADVDEYAVRCESGGADGHISGRFKAGMALEDCTVFQALQHGLEPSPRFARYAVFAGLDLFHVHADAGIDGDAEVSGPA